MTNPRKLALSLLTIAFLAPGWAAAIAPLEAPDVVVAGHGGALPLPDVPGACTPAGCLDVPLLVDEHGDTMTGDLAMEADIIVNGLHRVRFAPVNSTIESDELPTAPGVHAINVTVDGEQAPGFLAVPASGTSDRLVVLGHGYLELAEDYVDALRAFAENGSLALAMDFRGAPEAFKVRTGVNDTIAATLAVQAQHPDVALTVLYGFSMGGEIGGVAVAEAPPGTFDYWLSGAGVMDLAALWAEIPRLQPVFEAEAGGTPLEVPAAYAERSPVDRAGEIASGGLTRAYLFQGIADTLVPMDHGERMFQALEGAAVPVTLLTVTTNREAWACAPAVLVCGPRLPAGPSSHDAGTLQTVLPFILARLAGEPDDDGAAVRGVYDATTGRRVV